MIQRKSLMHSQISAPDVTPMVDIVFIVVVFLLITANSPLLKLPVNVPTSPASISESEALQTHVTITLSATGAPFAIDQSEFYSWEAFAESLGSLDLKSDSLVRIAPDKNAKTDHLLRVMAFLNHINITNTQIIMEQPQ